VFYLPKLVNGSILLGCRIGAIGGRLRSYPPILVVVLFVMAITSLVVAAMGAFADRPKD
jgi:hypothetical protein